MDAQRDILLQKAEDNRHHLVVIIGLTAHDAAHAAQIGLVEPMVGSLNGVKFGMGIELHGLL